MTNTTWLRDSIIVLVAAALMPVVAAAQTLERVTSAGTLNIGFVKDAAPFSSAVAGGGAEGYSIDLCLRVAKYLKSRPGLSQVNIKYTGTTVAEGLDMVARGDVDMLCGSITDTLKRRQSVSFSIPVYNGGIGVLVNDNADAVLVSVLNGEVPKKGPIWRATVNRGLSNHTYAVHAGTVTSDWVQDRVGALGVQVNIVPVDSHEAGVKMVADGKADAYFGDRAILANYSNSIDEVNLLTRYFNYEPIAIVVPRGDADLRLAVDTVLSELYLSDDFEGLYSKHFGAPPGKTSLMFFKAFARR